MPTSVRLDPETERTLERLARQRSQTKSDVLREAIRGLARCAPKRSKAATPFERVADLIGCVSGGPPDLSVDTGRKVGELLARRRAEEL